MASGYTGSGASSTRSVLIAADTRATATASSASRTASAAVRTTPAANPQVPSWITRTESPRSSPSIEASGRASRRLIVCVRIRSTRMSACSQPRSTARVSAASVSAVSGRTRKDSSTERGGTASVYQSVRTFRRGRRSRRPRCQADGPRGTGRRMVDPADDVTMTFGGTATMLLRIGAFTLLTDPNFLHRGQRAYLGNGLWTKRLTEPALQPTQLPALDGILLSHLHGDHWDRIATARLDRAMPIVTTEHAAR